VAEGAHEGLREQKREGRMQREIEGHLIIKFLKRSYSEAELLVFAVEYDVPRKLLAVDQNRG